MVVMMNIDELRRLAVKEELSLNYVAKDEMVSKVLLDLQGFDDLILKGGTAINRVYIKTKRFSEDIDFDLLFKGTAKMALSRTNKILEKLEGFRIAQPRIMKEVIRYDLFYTNPLQHQDRIMLEFHVSAAATHYTKRIVNFGFVPHDSALLRVYDAEELIKQKITCIMTRLEGKDFFDLFYLLDVVKTPVRISREKKELLLGRITLEKEQIVLVANVINHYIPRGQRPNWDVFLDELRKKVEKLA